MPRPLLFFAFGVVALSAAGGAPVWAADLPLKAPPAAPAWTWNGFYLGGHAGYAWAHDPVNEPLFAGQSTPSIGNINSQGALAGFQAGANWQSGAWVAGLEFDISATAARGSSSAAGTGPVPGLGVSTESLSLGDQVYMLGSSRVRLGYLVRPDLLLYGTGGLAWTLDEQSSNEVVTGATPLTATAAAPTFRFGWVAGAGAEVRLADTNWLARLEYLHYDFGDSANSISTTITGGVPATSVVTAGPLTVDLVRAGLSYKFGGASPAAASAGSGPYAWAPAARSTAWWTSPWSWSGFYVGAHAGYGWTHDPFDEFFGSGALNGVNGHGGLGGFQAGANWQKGRLVGGLEMDLSATGIRGQNGGAGTSSSAFFTTSQSGTLGEEFRLLGSARARLGYLVSPTTLVYGTGGLAWTEINQVSSLFTSNTLVAPPTTTTTSISNGSVPSWRFGWVVGIGAEQRIGTTNWIGRLEYLHYDFGTFEGATTSTTTGGVTTVTPLFASSHLTADVVRAGASYRFGSEGGTHAEVSDARPAPTSWNGFYLGVHGGGGFGNDPFNVSGGSPPLPDVHSSGWLAGGQAGASWQIDRWLAGVEIDASTTGIKGSSSATLVIAPFSESETLSDSFDLLGSARARLGWLAWPNLLVYGTGGLAWAQVTQGGIFESAAAGTTSTSVFSLQSWRWGWAAGLGAETRIGHGNWLGRVEYLHYDFGTSTSSTTVSAGTASVANEGRLTTDVVRVGVSYQLN